MKANSSVTPQDFYFFENPRDRSKIIVRFCKNIKKADIGFNYDEYEIEIDKTDRMDDYIKNHYEELLANASGGPSITQKIISTLDYISMMSGIDIPI